MWTARRVVKEIARRNSEPNEIIILTLHVYIDVYVLKKPAAAAADARCRPHQNKCSIYF